MAHLISSFVILPLLGFFLTLIIPHRNENLISRVAFFTTGLQLVGFLLFLTAWILDGHPKLNVQRFVLYSSDEYEFHVQFFFDRISAMYLFIGSVLVFLVTVYSRYYLHREKGYKRYFNTILFFYLGYTLVVTSGNFETLIIGWEMLGISSFLLIAFYRDRYLPVKNAVKVFTIYRVADVGLILVMWMSHHLWKENISFMELSDYNLVHGQLQAHSLTGIFISAMLLISASAKSAQLPFTSWLPRAMEGPTPSSAIFYGSLSVHVGVFLLLRTFPFWEHQFSVRVLIGLVGLTTSIIATFIARVQSSVKSQIAYSSSAQIGLIFIEVACGLQNLALIHFAGNAFLRTYQLLVSPSVVSYLIREQFYEFVPPRHSGGDSLPKRLEYTLYVISLKEWNLDSMMYRYMWNPLKWIGNKLRFRHMNLTIIILSILYLIGLFCVYHRDVVPHHVQRALPIVFSLIGLILVLKAFTERRNVIMSWLMVIMNHFWVALAVSFNERFSFGEVHIYLVGIAVSGVFGYACLRWLMRRQQQVDLNQFHGYAHLYPGTAFLFLLACLGLSGFPITPAFIGEDLIFSHIHGDQYALAACVALSLILDGIAVIRLYARVFMGPHVNSRNGVAYRSS